jgi:hypothetical protein
MTYLFTEDDVEELRRLGWPKRVDKRTESGLDDPDDELFSDLDDLVEAYRFQSGRIGTEGMAEDIRQADKDAKKLAKAFAKFSNRHECVIGIFTTNGHLQEAGHAIDKLCTTAASLASHLKGKHDPEVNAPKSAAKSLIKLWARDNGEPPTVTQGTGHWPAGKCFSYVLGKLTDAYGGELGDAALGKLLKSSRKKYKESLN